MQCHQIGKEMVQYTPNCCTSVANVTTLPRLTLPGYKLAWIHYLRSTLHVASPHPSVTFAALYPLQRLKAHFLAAKGSSGHRLFISAFMLALKIICDDTYSNTSWCIVGQEMFALREIIITRWSRRCATWSGNSTSIPRHCANFRIVSNAILLAQAPIHRWFSLAGTGTIHAPKCSLYACLCSPCTLAQMPPSFPAHWSPHTTHHPPTDTPGASTSPVSSVSPQTPPNVVRVRQGCLG
jgi:hypothetical protein